MSEIFTTPVVQEAPTIGRRRLLIGPAVSLALGLAVLLLAQGIEEPAIATGFSPRWWPEVIGALICVLSLGVAIKAVVRPDAKGEEETEPTRLGMVRVVLILVSVLVYGVLWYFLDFRIATLALVAAIVAILGGRGWKALILFPVIVTAVLYVVFGLLLRVPL